MAAVLLADGDRARHPRRDATREDVPPRGSTRRPGTAPGSTTSCDSPRPTATPRPARTRSPRRPTDRREFELTVERLDDGEVSTFLHDVVEVGDELEVRGPIGGWFVWDGDHSCAARRRGIGRRARSWRCCAWPGATGHADARAPRGLGALAPRPLLRRRAHRRRRHRRVHARDARRTPSGPSGASPPTTSPRTCAPTPTCTCAGRRRSRIPSATSSTGLGVDASRIRVERFGPSA